MSWFPAITVSRTLGSGGSLIAYQVARRLGWRYCDRSILRFTAKALGLDTVALSQQEERPDRLWENILCLLGTGTPEAPYAPPPDLPVYSKDLFDQESQIMARILEREPAVLVGRGGFVAFQDRPATLHVHIQASPEFRMRRLVDSGRAVGLKEAQKLIHASDRDRAGFIRDISGRDWLDPANFHLVLDPSRDGFQACEQSILDRAPVKVGVPE